MQHEFKGVGFVDWLQVLENDDGTRSVVVNEISSQFLKEFQHLVAFPICLVSDVVYQQRQQTPAVVTAATPKQALDIDNVSIVSNKERRRLKWMDSISINQEWLGSSDLYKTVADNDLPWRNKLLEGLRTTEGCWNKTQ